MRITRKLGRLSAIGVAVAALTGCVASEGSAYRKQLHRSLPDAEAADEGVEFAFGLDDDAPGPASVTVLRNEVASGSSDR